MTVSAKPLIWLLEEATPEIAQLMHQLERSLVGMASVQRVSYTDALRQLPREESRAGVTAVLVFTATSAQNLASLLRRSAGAPPIVFVPPRYEAIAALRCGQRWPASVRAVARHPGEAALLVSAGFRPENVIRLSADVVPSALPPEAPEAGAAVRVGMLWPNLAPAQREAIATEIRRWQQSAPERLAWHLYCLPGDAPDWDAPGVTVIELTREAVAARPRPQLDVWLVDPWWPELLPRPVLAPLHLFLAPGGAPGGGWAERLQNLLDAAAQAPLHLDALVALRFAPLWRHLLAGEEREPVAIAPVDVAPLEQARTRWQAWLDAERERLDAADADALAHYFALYDYRVQLSWCADLWRALATARNGERHSLLAAFNALPLQTSAAAWLLKRLMAKTPLARSRRTLNRRFWWRFARRHPALVWRWMSTLWRCGRDASVDPLGVSREVAERVLDEAGVRIRAVNAPQALPGMPVIYLLSHRHAALDPFLLLHVLQGELAVVVGPRAQRWPLIGRLGHSPAFVLTGQERGVVIADAIAAVRARRALALYPEVAEPTYLGEGGPLRSGLIWIVQALERSQVIPVALDDPDALGPDGGEVRLIFGPPIVCTPESGEELFHRVRAFFARETPQVSVLDTTGWRTQAIAQSETPVEPRAR
ncbi:MAG TPA: hypothetical protein V6D47_04590 [Oscillatoriaceae cyanobacterium]